ncbi:MAG: hypothetical protein ACO3MG_00885 [Saprospiraceae bacterium]|jgi:outer membrane biosynthesis protein TonB
MNRYLYAEEKDNRRAGLWLSILFHILLIFFFLVPCFKHFNNKMPEEPQGIMVALGDPSPQKKTYAKKAAEKVQSSKTEKKSPKAETVKKKTALARVKAEIVSKTVEEKSVVTAADLEKSRQDELKKKEEIPKADEARKEAEAEQKRLEEERKRQEAQKQAKSKFSSMFSTGDQDDNTSAGNPEGQPDSSVLDNLSTGKGRVGNGLGERELLYAPQIRDNTQKTGRVVINICVNKEGHVANAKYKQKGSTTTDAHLITLAEQSASKYRFSKSHIAEQCGDIIIDFKLR